MYEIELAIYNHILSNHINEDFDLDKLNICVSVFNKRKFTTILLDDISPESIGELIAVWENKTIFNSMFWDINPFDQWGVELGKINTKAELEK